MLALHKCRDIANEASYEKFTEGELLHILDNTRWDDIKKTHDWRNYIPDEIVAVWKELSFDARAVAFALARRRADNEDWD